MPCTPPPFGALVAIDLATGARAWDVPLGDPSTLAPGARRAAPKTPLGSPNLGGPIITAGGVVFIGATIDHVLRAFDIETGRELWQGAAARRRARDADDVSLPDGRQFVVICVGGSDEWGQGDYVVAFALPK